MSASQSEHYAKSLASARPPSSAPAPAPKLRSCVICRSRKVRCDKQSPCSNCRRANVACIFPSTDRPPKWSRRLDRLANTAAASRVLASQDAYLGVDQVMDRLRNLESLVRDLRGQLEQAHATTSSVGGSSSGVNSPVKSNEDHEAEYHRHASPASNTSSVQKQFGRLVLQDTSRSRYVSSGFWSRVNDELNGLEMDSRGLASDDSDTSSDETTPGKSPSSQELERTPSDRHAFLFRHNLSPAAHELRELHPLPSQIPFLLDVFSENVNFMCQIVHIPTVTKMMRDLRGSDMTRLTPSNEALLFSIYYAAITSMEEEDVQANFNTPKPTLSHKYRLGLESALARADFLNGPDITLVQAFAIFLALLRRHDSARFVWMMTGLLIRMAQYLGLQRDGAHFEHLTPFEIEIRRRVWWAVCNLDLRASEDQGTELTVPSGSFDTKIPLNINDADIGPDTKEMPVEHEGVTDMSFVRISVGLYEITRQLMAPGLRDGAAGLEDKSRLLNEIYQKYEQGYLRHTVETGNIAYWVSVCVARLVMAKMTLVVFLPVLFSSPTEHFSDEIRTKLLIAAIEVAEYNHALNDEQACRHLRWIFQTYTHWHSIVYLMIDISRRLWSPIVERAWIALHSSWLIPEQAPTDKNLRIWVPLRKLMAKARRHRNAELSRLRADPQAAARLDMEDREIPLPSSPVSLPGASGVDAFRERWYQLVGITEGPGDRQRTSGGSGAGPVDAPMSTAYTSQPAVRPIAAQSPGDLGSSRTCEQTYLDASGQQADKPLEITNIEDPRQANTTNPSSNSGFGQPSGLSQNTLPTVSAGWPGDARAMGAGFAPWLWTDADSSLDVFSGFDADFVDVNMNLDSEVNWYNWVESAERLGSDLKLSGDERA